MSKVVRIFSPSKDWKSWKIVGTALSAAIYLCRVVTGAWWCPEWVGASGECQRRCGRSTLCQFLLALIDLNTFVTAKSICWWRWWWCEGRTGGGEACLLSVPSLFKILPPKNTESDPKFESVFLLKKKCCIFPGISLLFLLFLISFFDVELLTNH